MSAASSQQNAEQFAEMQRLGQENLEKFFRIVEKNVPNPNDLKPMADAFAKLSGQFITNPQQMAELQMKLYGDYINLMANMADRMTGKDVAPMIEPEKGDRRFAHDLWQSSPVHDFMKQSYLLTCKNLMAAVEQADGMTEAEKEKTRFYTRQVLDAVSPSNFPLTNPEVLQETMNTNGENLVKGLHNFLADIERGGGKLKISMTDNTAFEVGKNIAVTEGEVVFKNRLIELIQYKPKGKQVHARPLLIFPPWINRYYILDLQPKNSFVRYAVEECGLNVFMVSWKNPDAAYKDVGFEDYLKEGLFEAVDQVLSITGEKDLNAIGYCIGGTLLASGLAVMAKKKDKRVNSATFFTTLIDFAEAGELQVFLDEPQVQAIEARMQEKGYLDGAEMAATFAMLRANDLVWGFAIQNYLMGKTPFPFDLLHWNDDPTRMPCAMHSYYLRNMYLENNLVKKDKLKLMGEKVDVSEIAQPIYYVTAKNDHITPWTGCYRPLPTMKSKDIRLILSKAGHVAAIANPPLDDPEKAKKRAFWAASVGSQKDPEKWLEKAEFQTNSWWADWKNWIEKQSGKKLAAPKKLGKGKTFGAAPGTYVKE